jgi:hypothetical protein
MIISAEDKWVGCSPALQDAIMCIDLMLKNRGIKAACSDVYLQYRKFDGFALNIRGERLDDETVAQCQLQFKDDYSDCNEYPHQYVAPRKEGEPYVTQLFVVENTQFYVLDSDDDREKYVNDWLKQMPCLQPEPYESVLANLNQVGTENSEDF